jgi:uncharacterized membrane protein
MPLNLHNWGFNKPLFLIKLACFKYFVTIMKAEEFTHHHFSFLLLLIWMFISLYVFCLLGWVMACLHVPLSPLPCVLILLVMRGWHSTQCHSSSMKIPGIHQKEPSPWWYKDPAAQPGEEEEVLTASSVQAEECRWHVHTSGMQMEAQSPTWLCSPCALMCMHVVPWWETQVCAHTPKHAHHSPSLHFRMIFLLSFGKVRSRTEVVLLFLENRK